MTYQKIIENVSVNDLSHDGRGIGRVDQKVAFIDLALPGEIADIQVCKNKSSLIESKVLNIRQENPELRVTAACPHFLECGGCSLQHLKWEAQIEFKQKQLLQQIKHHVGLESTAFEILSPITGDAFGYRRKARLGIKWLHKKNKLLIGFREKYNPGIADLKTCLVLRKEFQIIWDELQPILSQSSIKEQFPQLEIGVGDDGLVALVLRNLKPVPESEIDTLKNWAKTQGLNFYLQPKGPESIIPVWESGILSYRLQDKDLNYDLSYEFSALDFVQVNQAVNAKMLKQALHLMNIQKEDRVLDLFSGMGNFSLPMAAQNPASLVGVEGEKNLVARAQTKAEQYKLRAEFFLGDLFKDPSTQAWAHADFNKVLIDPPRAGAEAVVQWLAAKPSVKSVVYVSCHPATLVRDMVHLLEGGFELKKLGVLDMFTHTTHVESMAYFDRD
ncbi:MAG: 23S rRNA (uracil(1939)-C(5))-methyltransferase RlmD [Gammaproteobacteria bacterium]